MHNPRGLRLVRLGLEPVQGVIERLQIALLLDNAVYPSLSKQIVVGGVGIHLLLIERLLRTHRRRILVHPLHFLNSLLAGSHLLQLLKLVSFTLLLDLLLALLDSPPFLQSLLLLGVHHGLVFVQTRMPRFFQIQIARHCADEGKICRSDKNVEKSVSLKELYAILDHAYIPRSVDRAVIKSFSTLECGLGDGIFGCKLSITRVLSFVSGFLSNFSTCKDNS